MKSFFSVITLLFIGGTVAIELDPLHHRNQACLLPYSKGIGHLPQVRIYYDKSVNKCVEFVYYGWGGNGNRFSTKKQCNDACKIRTIKTTTIKPSTRHHTHHTKPHRSSTTKKPNLTTSNSGSHAATCNLPLPPARNWPPNTKTAYAYDPKANQCFYVYYDEGTLNANNFPTREACMAYCNPKAPTEQTPPTEDTICSLPPPPTMEWPADSKVGFWYDEKSGRCEPVYYDEKNKNANNFNSVEECLKICSHQAQPSTSGSPVESTTPKSRKDDLSTTGSHQQSESVPSTTASHPRFDDFTTTAPSPSDPSIVVDSSSTTESSPHDPFQPELPTTSQPAKTERDRICNLPGPPNRDWTDHDHTGYHYDAETEECDLVYYDEETKNENLFQTLDECFDFCLPDETTTDSSIEKENTTEPALATNDPAPATTPEAPTTPKPTTQKPTTPKPKKLTRNEVLKFRECALQPYAGHCKARIHSYYFNITTMQCQVYNYGGCGATANHYRNLEACEKSCIYREIPHFRPPPVAKQPSQWEKYCKISKIDGFCMKRSHVGYAYNHKTQKCEHKVLNRCLRPAGLHQNKFDCDKFCILY